MTCVNNLQETDRRRTGIRRFLQDGRGQDPAWGQEALARPSGSAWERDHVATPSAGPPGAGPAGTQGGALSRKRRLWTRIAGPGMDPNPAAKASARGDSATIARAPRGGWK